MINKTRGNTTEFVHQMLLQDLQKGTFAPGEKLTGEMLAQRYGVSRTPVRQALVRLERDGFLDSVANAGYILHPLSVKDLCELYDVREAIEGLAAEKLAENGASPELIAALRECCRIRRESKEFEERAAADRKFHELIYDNCGSHMIQQLAANYVMLSTVFSFTRYFLLNKPVGSSASANREHDAIVDAIAAGDGKLARKRLAAHIATARKRIIKFANAIHPVSKGK